MHDRDLSPSVLGVTDDGAAGRPDFLLGPRRHARPASYSGSARPTLSATHAGFSDPSTSTVN
ncbi:MAG: hypothetical protein ACRDL3_10565, partial [Solirubrobacterales bacterium]